MRIDTNLNDDGFKKDLEKTVTSKIYQVTNSASSTTPQAYLSPFENSGSSQIILRLYKVQTMTSIGIDCNVQFGLSD